jgi:hypothetical protein
MFNGIKHKRGLDDKTWDLIFMSSQLQHSSAPSCGQHKGRGPLPQLSSLGLEQYEPKVVEVRTGYLFIKAKEICLL